MFKMVNTDIKTSGGKEGTTLIEIVRMCDGCKSRVNPNDAVICECSTTNCPIKSYDLCPSCIKQQISQIKCPQGYGCNY